MAKTNKATSTNEPDELTAALAEIERLRAEDERKQSVIDHMAGASASLRYELAKAKREKAALEATLPSDFVPLADVVPKDKSISYNAMLVALRAGEIRHRRDRTRYFPSLSAVTEWLRLHRKPQG